MMAGCVSGPQEAAGSHCAIDFIVDALLPGQLRPDTAVVERVMKYPLGVYAGDAGDAGTLGRVGCDIGFDKNSLQI